MQEAFPDIDRKDIARLSLAYQSSRKSQQEWEMEFSDHIQALDDLCATTTSSSTETCDLLERAKELIKCWKPGWSNTVYERQTEKPTLQREKKEQ